MSKKIHLKRKRVVINKKNKILITIITLITAVTCFIGYIDTEATPILLEMANLKISELSTTILNESLVESLEDEITTENILKNNMNASGQIQTVDFNSIVVNRILTKVNNIAQKKINEIEDSTSNITKANESQKNNKKYIVLEIPLGVITKNSMLSNLGPKIPIKLLFIGNINSNIVTEIKQYGINNALIEIGIKFELTVKIILPFKSDTQKFESTIPIAIKIIEGSVPSYYGSGIQKESSLFTIPID